MKRIVTIGLTATLLALIATQSWAQEKSASSQVRQAANRLKKRQLYDLKYKFIKGESIQWIVEHTASTKMQMAGSTDESSSRVVTKKCWKVRNVDVHGNMTFVHSLESMDAWQQVGDSDPITYNSKKDTKPPEEYELAAEQLNKPLAVFTIKPNGSIIDRKSPLKESSFGVGKITIPLPDKPIAIGKQWQVPTLLNANDEYGNQKKIKARILYELAKVEGQLASIKFKTELLTTVSKKVKSTIMQQMTEGMVVFDMQQGRPVAKHVQWDEKAVGFEGPDSLLKLVGKMAERLVVNASEPKSTQTKAAPSSKAKTVQIKTSDSKPILRSK